MRRISTTMGAEDWLCLLLRYSSRPNFICRRRVYSRTQALAQAKALQLLA